MVEQAGLAHRDGEGGEAQAVGPDVEEREDPARSGGREITRLVEGAEPVAVELGDRREPSEPAVQRVAADLVLGLALVVEDRAIGRTFVDRGRRQIAGERGQLAVDEERGVGERLGLGVPAAEDPEPLPAELLRDAVAVRCQPVRMVVRVELAGQGQLAFVAHAACAQGAGLRTRQRRQEQRRQHRDHRDDHQQFDECERVSGAVAGGEHGWTVAGPRAVSGAEIVPLFAAARGP